MKKALWVIFAAVFCLALAGCQAAPEQPEEPEGLEALLVSNGREPFRCENMDINGTLLQTAPGSMVPADFYLELLGEPEEILYEQTDAPTVSQRGRPAVLRFAGDNEMRADLEATLQERPLWVHGLCLTGTPAVTVQGIRVGDTLETVLSAFRIDQPERTTLGDRDVWMLYDDGVDAPFCGYIAMDGETPDYVCYVDGMALVYDLDENGAVEEIRYRYSATDARRYEAPELLYPYARDPSVTRYPGNLQTDCLRPCFDANGYYAVAGNGMYQLSYLLPELEPGEGYAPDYTAMMQDAIFIMSSWAAVETVRFSLRSPAWNYERIVDIDLAAADAALGASLRQIQEEWRETGVSGGEVDFTEFDRMVRAVTWEPELEKEITWEQVTEGAGDMLADISRPALSAITLNGYQVGTSLRAYMCSSWFGLPVDSREIPAYDGAAAYRVDTYADGSMAGGWGEDGVGAFYLTGDNWSNVNGICLGDSAEKVIRSFRVEGARETSLPDYDVADAVVLYGEVIHMGSYGYAVRADGAYARIVYGVGGAGVVTFLLDEEGCVSAIRCQLEENMRLPMEAE